MMSMSDTALTLRMTPMTLTFYNIINFCTRTWLTQPIERGTKGHTSQIRIIANSRRKPMVYINKNHRHPHFEAKIQTENASTNLIQISVSKFFESGYRNNIHIVQVIRRAWNFHWCVHRWRWLPSNYLQETLICQWCLPTILLTQ